MAGSSVARVIKTKNPKFVVGDIVVAYKGWVSHGIINQKESETIYRFNAEMLKTVKPSTALGVLGMPGMTAYLGLKKVCDPKEGEVLVVSGAAGAVGSLVGQIGKLLGCTVIGTAGSDEKCEYLKSLGFDHVANYKTTKDLKAWLDQVAPKGVDCFFDNTGGEIQDAVLRSLRSKARICICGQISEYNSLNSPSVGPRLLYNLIYTESTIKGFMVMAHGLEWPQGIQQMFEWIQQGKIKYNETVNEGGIEATPAAFIALFTGGNTGKQLVKLAD